MGQRLSETAACGMSSAIALDPEQVSLLTAGDIEGLLEFHSSVFGSATMATRDEDDDEDDDDHDDDDSDEDDDDEDDEDDDDSDEDDDEDEADKGKARRKPKVDPKDTKIQELSAEAKRYRLKNRDYRSQLAAKDAEIARLKGTSKSDKDESPKDESKNTGLTDRERQQAVQLEFVTDKTYAWQDPKAALKLLDLHDVDVDDDGTVEGLSDAIEKLAKDYPFLLAETPDEKKDRKAEQGRRRQGPTGQSTRTRKKGTPDQKKLIAAYNIQR